MNKKIDPLLKIDKQFSSKLKNEDYIVFEKIADEMGVGVGTLTRMLIMEFLHKRQAEAKKEVKA